MISSIPQPIPAALWRLARRRLGTEAVTPPSTRGHGRARPLFVPPRPSMKPLAQTDVAALPDPVREVVERFANDWEKSLQGGPVPSVETFLGQVTEADRPGARAVLERVDAEYRRREQANGATVDIGTIEL